MKRGRRKKGQIWVETVIYTLIAFAMIGLALAFVKPKIDEIQDKGIIEQSIALLEDLNDVVTGLGDPGNQRVIEIGINKGTLKIDGINERIIFEVESKFEFSEPGEDILEGNVLIHTQKIGDINEVNLTINYANYNLSYNDKDELQLFSKSSTPYKILISHKGEDAGNRTRVNFELLN